VIAYTYTSGKVDYHIHALDLGSLSDKTAPVLVAASVTLTDRSKYHFNPATSRQRAALLFSNGTVYAGFSSFCDNSPSTSRGWVLGWNGLSMNRLPETKSTNRVAASPNTFFLSSVWMSGYGIAADEVGDLLFVTGNSDPAGTVYYGANLAQSVVKMAPDLSKVLSFFTPGPPPYGRWNIQQDDQDFGAGGALVLPVQPGMYPHLAVAAGKVGQMYLLDRDSLGGYSTRADKVFGRVPIGLCWCGQSYFQGADGVGRVVSSGGNQVIVWKVNSSPTGAPSLTQESISAPLATGQDSGFFTSVSSNGEQAGTQLVWALSRPDTFNPAANLLYAFDPSTLDQSGRMATVFTGVAGAWPNGDGNANLVPLVAGGRVYVASFQELTIFGLATGTSGKPPKTPRPALPTPPKTGTDGWGRRLYGVVRRVQGSRLIVETRRGEEVTVDRTAAQDAEASAVAVVGQSLLIRGDYDAEGVLHAASVQRAKSAPALWQPDR
jgi:hypothetical protein